MISKKVFLPLCLGFGLLLSGCSNSQTVNNPHQTNLTFTGAISGNVTLAVVTTVNKQSQTHTLTTKEVGLTQLTCSIIKVNPTGGASLLTAPVNNTQDYHLSFPFNLNGARETLDAVVDNYKNPGTFNMTGLNASSSGRVLIIQLPSSNKPSPVPAANASPHTNAPPTTTNPPAPSLIPVVYYLSGSITINADGQTGSLSGDYVSRSTTSRQGTSSGHLSGTFACNNFLTP